MSQPMRTSGGLIDRTQPVRFRFDGRSFSGFAGDTLASALVANRIRLLGRSFKYHRPRGLLSAGSEEPNALVSLHEGVWQDPNCRATTTELFNGLVARSQNHLGSLSFDLLAVNDWLKPFLSAGFYYKTFMWPPAWWEKVYEPLIRRAAGLGALSGHADPGLYDRGFRHADVLVIGGGAAGLSAALQAGRSGARVILADEDFVMGGRLNAEQNSVDGQAGVQWVAQAVAELASMPNVRLMTRSTVFGAYDHGVYGVLERTGDHLPVSDQQVRQVYWRITARRAILCAGATERPLAFPNNDRPGIMLAGACRTYVNRYAALAGRQVVVFTNNDDAYRTVADMQAAGARVSAVVDLRTEPSSAVTSLASDVRVITNASVVDTRGRLGLRSLTLSNGESIAADCLAVSGGWSPNVHLTCHQGERPVWREDLAAFVPGSRIPADLKVAGAAAGNMTLGDALQDGWAQANAALSDIGQTPTGSLAPQADDEARACAAIFQAGPKARSWVDFQNDVTCGDIEQAQAEGFRSVEHLKRYTTLGMATDQGRAANVVGLAVLAGLTGRSIAETGTTVFRPPYTPVAISAFAGRSRGSQFRPRRLTPSHHWAQRRGAVMGEAGAWMRAQYFPLPDEQHWRESVDREVLQVRRTVGVCDVTTLGKVDVQGRDAAVFLNRVYANGFAQLAVGRTRYGLILREDGVVMDDGTAARLAEFHFVVTTTTANAVSVYRHMEFCRQCLWPELDVSLISSTEQWAQLAIAGPRSRELITKLVDDNFDVSNDAFPFMACATLSVCGGTPARLFRISFSGELAYELAVPARYGESLMEVTMLAGAEYDIVPYGTEALGVLRIEKGHAAGNELTGTSTAQQLGLGAMLSKPKDAIGRVLAGRAELADDDGLALVGFVPVDRSRGLRAGAHLITRGKPATQENDEGWLTSTAHSPNLGHAIGLGFLKRGRHRIGEIVCAADPLRGESYDVEVVSPHFIDPDGERLRV